MTHDPLLNFHAERLHHFLHCWHAGGAPAAGVSAEAAAYYLLEHAGMLRRYAGDDEVTAGLKDLDAADRAKLVRDACAFMGGIGLANKCRQLVGGENPDAEQVHLLSQVLEGRDELETAVSLAREVAGPLTQHDAAVQRGLTDARARLDEIDKVLEAHRGLTALACRELQGVFARIDPTIRQGLNLRRYWWFDLFREEPVWVRLARQLIAGLRFRPGPVAAAAETPDVAALKAQLEGASATVADDPNVTLAFDLVPWPADPTRLQWRIWLSGPAGAWQRYAAVVARLPGADEPLRAPLTAPGLALIPLDHATQRLLAGGLGSVRLALVDQEGAEHPVE